MKPYKNQDPIRLVVADVDGTLVTQEKGLTAKDAKLRNVWDGFCLEEATELSPGFNPGNHPSKRFALKGREVSVDHLTCRLFKVRTHLPGVEL